MNEAEVIVAEVLDPKSEKAPYWIKDGNGKVYKTWNSDQAKFARELLGDERQVKITYEERESSKDGRTFTDLIVKEIAGPLREAEKPESEVDWDAKERRMTRSALWKSYLEGDLPNQHRSLLLNEGDLTAQDFNKAVFEMARHLLHAAELDIYRGFLTEKDIPF